MEVHPQHLPEKGLTRARKRARVCMKARKQAIKEGSPVSQRVTVAARVDKRVTDSLDEIAKRRRKSTGEDLRKADLIREALEEFVEKHLPERQA